MESSVQKPKTVKLGIRGRHKVDLRIRKKEAEKLRKTGHKEYRVRNRVRGILELRSNNCNFFVTLSASVAPGVPGLFRGEEGGRCSSSYLVLFDIDPPSVPQSGHG